MTTTIRPPRLDRVLNTVVFGPVAVGTGIVLASVAFVPGVSARVFCFVLGAAVVALGTVVSVRLPRVAVRLTEDRLEYVGFLLSWSARGPGSTPCSTTPSSSGGTSAVSSTGGRSGC